MAVIETWFEQDLQKAVQVQHLDGSLFSNNANGNRIGVAVYNNGVAASLSGTVSGYAVLSDGTTVPCTGSLSGNRASVLIPAAAYQPGIIFVSVFLTSGSTVTTLAAVAANVQQARTDNQVSPGSVITDWTQTINAAMQSVVTANAANMAVEYGSLTYPVPVGKYTIYNNLLYKCTTPIATEETWTASHWTRVRIADDVADIKIEVDGAVKFSSVQNLTEPQKAQARANIGTYSKNETDNVSKNAVNDNAVKFSSAQSLTEPQKAQARANIDTYGTEQIDNFLWFLKLRYVGIVDSNGRTLADTNGNLIGGMRWYADDIVQDVIDDNAVKFSSAQSLTEPQKAQARANIDTYSKAETDNVSKDTVDGNAVKFSSAQSLTEPQKAQARANIDTYSKAETDNVSKDTVDGNAVKFSSVQNLTNPQKAQARANIDTYDGTEINNIAKDVVNNNSVKFSSVQGLSEPQKAQARSNIDAYSIDQISQFLWFLELTFAATVNESNAILSDPNGNSMGGSVWLPKTNIFANITA